MRVFRSDNISRVEWQWVAFWGGFLVLLTLIPYAWASLAPRPDWQFFGILANPADGATYLSKIGQGMDGAWQWNIQHTPDQHDPAALFTFYLALGHLARFFGFSSIVVYHLARITTSFFMFAALYQLGATVWQRLRPRRFFFWLSAFGSGLGWLLLPVAPSIIAPDISVPEAFPLYAAFTNPHFPLSIGLLAMLTALYLQVLRPGFDEPPQVDNGGLNILVFTILLVIVQPSALIVFGGAMTIFIAITGYRARQMPWHEVRWFSMLFLPTAPFLMYYSLILNTNDVIRLYSEQYIDVIPSLWLLLVGYGLLFIIGTPAIYRAFRRFDRDGDQLMLVWLLFNLIAIYLPISLHIRLLVGLTIPITYFAVRAIEDYWIEAIPDRWRRAAIIGLFVGIIPSNVLVMALPLYSVVVEPENGQQTGVLVQAEYSPLYDWLEVNGQPDEVALAAPLTSLWIPAESDVRVVYGHSAETVRAHERLALVETFYSGQNCTQIFEQDFAIDYVIWGPLEDALAEDILAEDESPDVVANRRCQAILTAEASLIQDFSDGAVTLYILRRPR